MRRHFEYQIIDADPPGSEIDITLLGDLTGNGRPDIIVGSKRGDCNLWWYENPGWQRHTMAAADNLEAGGVLVDLTGNGRLDVIAGMQGNGRDLYWFECPEDPRMPWQKYLITNQFQKYHDQIIADIDNDGRDELIIASQRAGIVAYWDIPQDPRVSPWPDDCLHIITENLFDAEGLWVGDIDGDGSNELLVGPDLFRKDTDSESWQRYTYAPGFVMTRVAVACFTGRGHANVVLCEGESHPGRLAIVDQIGQVPRLLRDDLFHPHSLQIADFDRDGNLDIMVAEMGLGRHDNPRMIIFYGDGDGDFEEEIISEGIATHEAKVADVTGNGFPDIVGKPYHPESHVDIWLNTGGTTGD